MTTRKTCQIRSRTWPQKAAFAGMLTDPCSFLSCARHEYFRGILRGLIGTRAENGEYPHDEALLTAIVHGICRDNAAVSIGF